MFSLKYGDVRLAIDNVSMEFKAKVLARYVGEGVVGVTIVCYLFP